VIESLVKLSFLLEGKMFGSLANLETSEEKLKELADVLFNGYG
jgi:hypothetical protein